MKLTVAATATLLDAGQYAAILEEPFTDAVLALAKECGWKSFHVRPARTAHGWRSPIQGDGVGWPDVFLARGTRLIGWELKSMDGKTTPAQIAWLLTLGGAGVEVAIMRPGDWIEIKRILK